MPVEVAVIPAAGRGTRMQPATFTVPKPLIPVLEKPVIQYVVEEAAEAGITEVVFVVGDDARVLDHFTGSSPVPGLEHISFSAVRQPEPLGLGHAVLCAREAVGDRPFLVQLSDMFPVPGESFTHRMTESERGMVAVQHVDDALLDRYGVVAIGDWLEEDVATMTGAVEKPGAANAPSDLGILGRYTFPSRTFDVLAALPPGHGGEIQLTDAIDALAKEGALAALVVEHALLDTGVPLGLAEATVSVGLRRPDLSAEFRLHVAEELSASLARD
ncbi:MAG: UTP--glucose-1-phosphate uridylyltransferase [Acidimicrobiia bacterium]|nr:UTP--glucose-1-phosphate uridylyltransferase [Acidimicrobiia bacterium]